MAKPIVDLEYADFGRLMPSYSAGNDSVYKINELLIVVRFMFQVDFDHCPSPSIRLATPFSVNSLLPCTCLTRRGWQKFPKSSDYVEHCRRAEL